MVKMLLDFKKIQHNVRKMIECVGDKGDIRSRNKIMTSFTIILLGAVFCGLYDLLSFQLVVNILFINLFVGVYRVDTISHRMEKNLAVLHGGEIAFWNAYKSIIKSDMKKAGVSVVGNQILVSNDIDAFKKEVIANLVSKKVCSVVYNKGETIFELPLPFPENISEVKTIGADQLIEWSNAISLIFMILYSGNDLV